MRFCKIYLLLLLALPLQAQTVMEGKIVSMNGEAIPKVVITANNQLPSDIFSDNSTMEIREDDSYRIEFETAGIYSVRIYSVFHHTFSFPLLVYDQSPIRADIHILPKMFNDGSHFDKPEYLEWIRVYGDFNNYDYDEGTLFSLNNDGSLTALISADSDTIRYQIRGLTSGVSVLPGAESYHQRKDRSFEAVITKPSDSEYHKIHYDPNQPFPYPRTVPDSSYPIHIPYRGFITFSDPHDRYWIEPLSLRNRYAVPYIVLQPDEGVPADSSLQVNIRSMNSEVQVLDQIQQKTSEVERALEISTLHKQQRSALYIAYAGLVHQAERWVEMLNRNGTEMNIEELVNPEVLMKAIQEVSPVHPLWQHEIPLTMTDMLDQHNQAIGYVEEMARHHMDDRLVRNAILYLTRLKAAEYTDVSELPYYRWVIERYGDRNLARITRQTFQQEHKK